MVVIKNVISNQRQFLQQHVHHCSIPVLLEGLGLLRHLLCLCTALGLHCKRLSLTFNLKETKGWDYFTRSLTKSQGLCA